MYLSSIWDVGGYLITRIGRPRGHRENVETLHTDNSRGQECRWVFDTVRQQLYQLPYKSTELFFDATLSTER